MFLFFSTKKREQKRKPRPAMSRGSARFLLPQLLFRILICLPLGPSLPFPAQYQRETCDLFFFFSLSSWRSMSFYVLGRQKLIFVSFEWSQNERASIQWRNQIHWRWCLFSAKHSNSKIGNNHIITLALKIALAEAYEGPILFFLRGEVFCLNMQLDLTKSKPKPNK